MPLTRKPSSCSSHGQQRRDTWGRGGKVLNNFHIYILHIHIQIHTNKRTNIHAYTHARILTCTHAHIHACIHTNTHTHTHTHIHTQTHTHTHTHTHSHSLTHTQSTRKGCAVATESSSGLHCRLSWVCGAYTKHTYQAYMHTCT